MAGQANGPQRRALGHAGAAASIPRSRLVIPLRRAVAGLWLILGAVTACADSMPNEHEQKARFLLNFARFVEWPTNAFASAKAPFVVALFGEVAFADQVEKEMAGKRVFGRPVVLQQTTEVDEIIPCQLLYVAPSEDARLELLFERIRSQPVLTVGESKVFMNQRGCIQFFSEQGRVAFRLNLDAALEAKLTISSKLIRIAKPFYLPPQPPVTPKS